MREQDGAAITLLLKRQWCQNAGRSNQKQREGRSDRVIGRVSEGEKGGIGQEGAGWEGVV